MYFGYGAPGVRGALGDLFDGELRWVVPKRKKKWQKTEKKQRQTLQKTSKNHLARQKAAGP